MIYFFEDIRNIATQNNPINNINEMIPIINRIYKPNLAAIQNIANIFDLIINIYFINSNPKKIGNSHKYVHILYFNLHYELMQIISSPLV